MIELSYYHKNKYEPGNRIGPYNILFLRETKTTSYGHRYGEFLCPICNENIFEAKVYHVTSGKIIRCKACRAVETSGANNPNFKNLLGKRYGKLVVIKYLGSKNLAKNNANQKKSIWLCRCDCGRTKEVIGNSLQRGLVNSCGQCNFCSNGEFKLAKIFQNLHISYESQKRFDNCVDKFTLPFDFYLPDYNCCIEYDGTSHYKPNLAGSWCTVDSILKTQEHDKIKNDFCQNNAISLIRIPYWDFDILSEKYILDKLKNIN